LSEKYDLILSLAGFTMGLFRLHLYGQSFVDVNLPEADIFALGERFVSRSGTLIGSLVNSDENGVCPMILVPVQKVMFAIALD